MLKKEQIAKIAEALKLDAKAFEEAITATDEKEVVIPEVQVFTAEELTARDEAKLTEGKKTGAKEAEAQGKELIVKELKKTFGVEFEGKDPAKLTEAIKAQLAKGDEGLRQQVQQLQSTLTAKEQEVEAEKAKAQTAIFDTSLIASLPKNRKSLTDGGFTDKEYLSAIKQNIDFETVDGVTVAKRNGQIIQDAKTFKPLPIDAAVNTFFTERKWTAEEGVPAGGRGGSGAGGGAKFGKLSEVIAAWEADGKSSATAEFQQHVNTIAKENKDFVFDAPSN